MRVLLVWELIPEETQFYVFDNVNPAGELARHLMGANGCYGNYDSENESTNFLNEFLVKQPKTKIEDLPKIGAVDMVVHSGFGL